MINASSPDIANLKVLLQSLITQMLSVRNQGIAPWDSRFLSLFEAATKGINALFSRHPEIAASQRQFFNVRLHIKSDQNSYPRVKKYYIDLAAKYCVHAVIEAPQEGGFAILNFESKELYKIPYHSTSLHGHSSKFSTGEDLSMAYSVLPGKYASFSMFLRHGIEDQFETDPIELAPQEAFTQKSLDQITEQDNLALILPEDLAKKLENECGITTVQAYCKPFDGPPSQNKIVRCGARIFSSEFTETKAYFIAYAFRMALSQKYSDQEIAVRYLSSRLEAAPSSQVNINPVFHTEDSDASLLVTLDENLSRLQTALHEATLDTLLSKGSPFLTAVLEMRLALMRVLRRSCEKERVTPALPLTLLGKRKAPGDGDKQPLPAMSPQA